MAYACKYLLKNLFFTVDGLVHCCEVYQGRMADTACRKIPFTGGVFPFDFYDYSVKKIIEGISQRTDECYKCKQIQQYDCEPKYDGLRAIVIANYTECNLECCYCSIGKKITSLKGSLYTPESYYDPTPALENMYQAGYIHPNCVVYITGGEPTLYKYLPSVLAFIKDHNLGVYFLSNANKWSACMADALEKVRYAHLCVSLDAGSVRSYERVKGYNLLSQTVENLKKYSEVGWKGLPEQGRVSLKYIITPYAATEDDLYGFLKIAAEVKPSKVVISTDLVAYKKNRSKYEQLFPFVIKLNKLLVDEGYRIQYYEWTVEDINFLFGANISECFCINQINYPEF